MRKIKTSRCVYSFAIINTIILLLITPGCGSDDGDVSSDSGSVESSVDTEKNENGLSGASYCSAGKTLYFMAGCTSNSSAGTKKGVYKSKNGGLTWDLVSNLPDARTLGNAIFFDNKIYYIGGKDGCNL